MLYTELWSSMTMTSKQALWRQYYAAVKSGRKEQAEDILKKIHSAGRPAPRAGGCSRCRKKF